MNIFIRLSLVVSLSYSGIVIASLNKKNRKPISRSFPISRLSSSSSTLCKRIDFLNSLKDQQEAREEAQLREQDYKDYKKRLELDKAVAESKKVLAQMEAKKKSRESFYGAVVAPKPIRGNSSYRDLTDVQNITFEPDFSSLESGDIFEDAYSY